MPVAHLGINTEKFEEIHNFYVAALKPLGYAQRFEFKDGAVRGYGPKFAAPDFWISTAPTKPEEVTPGNGGATGFLHYAFSARTRNDVRAFYDAAIAAGGQCNGKPGLRPESFFTYYGAYVLDPEGRNIEAVCMKPGFWAEEWSYFTYATLGGALALGANYWYAWYDLPKLGSELLSRLPL